jgi:hypothetical protein
MGFQVPDLLLDLYQQLKLRALSQDAAGFATVLILVHPDIDSICSLRILTVLKY